MNEIVIRCLACGATTARGGSNGLPAEEEVLRLAQHNPGCPIGRTDHHSMVHVGAVTTLRPAEKEDAPPLEETKTVYSILVFPTYRD